MTPSKILSSAAVEDTAVPPKVKLVASNPFTANVAKANPEEVLTVVLGASLLLPVVENNFHLSESEASLNNPEYFVPESTYLPYQPMSTASPELLSANAKSGSFTVTVEDETVVVVPDTVKFPAIVTLSGKPISSNSYFSISSPASIIYND